MIKSIRFPHLLIAAEIIAVVALFVKWPQVIFQRLSYPTPLLTFGSIACAGVGAFIVFMTTYSIESIDQTPQIKTARFSFWFGQVIYLIGFISFLVL